MPMPPLRLAMLVIFCTACASSPTPSGGSPDLDGGRAEGGSSLHDGALQEDGAPLRDSARPSACACSESCVLDFCPDGHGARLKPSYVQHSQHFGAALAMVGEQLFVGMPRQGGCESGRAANPSLDAMDEGCADAGAVSIFERVDGAWEQVSYLKAEDAAEGSRFGASLAANATRLVVGAPGEGSCADSSDGCEGSGAVYVFEREAGTWVQRAKLKAQLSDRGDAFGSSVALDGERLAVGAIGEDSCAIGVDGDASENTRRCENAGAAYVFRREADWQQTGYFKAAYPFGDFFFGESVALEGSLLAVGSPREGHCGTGVNARAPRPLESCEESGAAYLYRDRGGWSLDSYVKASNADPFDRFGAALAITHGRVLVGAPQEDTCVPGYPRDDCQRVGAVYAFEGGDPWVEVQMLKPDYGDEWIRTPRFGASISAIGEHLLVGAPSDASCGRGVSGSRAFSPICPHRGAMFAFRYSDAWQQTLYVKATDAPIDEQRAYFGARVALSTSGFAGAAPADRSCVPGIDGGPGMGRCTDSGVVYAW